MTEELARRENPDAKKQLVLGFDAGCSTCSDVAKLIEGRVDGKLAVRNLRDPEVRQWRDKALGVAAPWAPTLFELGPGRDEVRAWVGVKMSLALGRRLGPKDSWRVMQALGEIGAVPRIEESALVGKLPEKAQEAVAGMSRGQFLKGVGGAAVAASLLSGGPFVSPAEAATRKPYDIVKGRRMIGSEMTKAARQVGSSIDVKNLVGFALATPARVSAAKPIGFMHTLRNGTAQRVIIFDLGSGRRVAHSEFAAPPKSVARSRAFLFRADGKKSVMTKASEGGNLWRRASGGKTQSQGSGRALGECPPVGNTPPTAGCWHKERKCVSWSHANACVDKGGSVTGGCAACLGSVIATSTGLATLIGSGGAIATCPGCFGGSVGARDCCLQWCEVWVLGHC